MKLELNREELEALIIGLKEVQINKDRFDERYKELAEKAVPSLLQKLKNLKRRWK